MNLSVFHGSFLFLRCATTFHSAQAFARQYNTYSAIILKQYVDLFYFFHSTDNLST